MSNNKEEEKLVSQYQEGITAYNLQEKLLIDKCFVQLKAELMIRFEQTGYKDTEDRTEIWRKMQTIAWLEQCLTDIANSGKIAEDELQRRGFFSKFKRKKG